MRINVIAPHIDDEMIGPGGSILKHIDKGNLVDIIYVSSGREEKEKAIREREAVDVCQYLGINRKFFLRQDPKNIDQQYIENIVQIFRRTQPDFVYMPHENDSDIEHTNVTGLSIRSIWLANNSNHMEEIKGQSNIKGVFLYEIHSPIQQVNYLEDISSFAEEKKKTINMYSSQTKISNHAEGILGINKYRGISNEFSDFAEAFQMLRFCNLFEMIK